MLDSPKLKNQEKTRMDCINLQLDQKVNEHGLVYERGRLCKGF